MEKTREWRYPLCVFLASVCFSTGGLFIKMIPWSALAINGARNLIGAAVIGIYLLVTGRKIIFNLTVMIGALSMIGVTTLFAIANKLTTAANAIVLQFTAPVFVILFVAVLYKQRTGKADIATCVAVLLGVVLFFVDGIRAGNLWGNVIAILSGVCYAGVFMMNTGKNADAISSCFIGQLTAGVIFTPLVSRDRVSHRIGRDSGGAGIYSVHDRNPAYAAGHRKPADRAGADSEPAAGGGILRRESFHAVRDRIRHRCIFHRCIQRISVEKKKHENSVNFRMTIATNNSCTFYPTSLDKPVKTSKIISNQ